MGFLFIHSYAYTCQIHEDFMYLYPDYDAPSYDAKMLRFCHNMVLSILPARLKSHHQSMELLTALNSHMETVSENTNAQLICIFELIHELFSYASINKRSSIIDNVGPQQSRDAFMRLHSSQGDYSSAYNAMVLQAKTVTPMINIVAENQFDPSPAFYLDFDNIR